MRDCERSAEIDSAIFKAYDIRGIADTQLGGDVPAMIGRAFASVMSEGGQAEVAVGRDGRLSSPRIAGGLVDGLVGAGVRVVDIGVVPTPMLYEYALKRSSGNGIMVTGSHNPKEHNGMKMMLGGKPVVDGQVSQLGVIAARPASGRGGRGKLERDDFMEDYARSVAGSVEVKRPVKVVVDCGNGAAGVAGPMALRLAGCEVVGLHAEIDGNFPNHHPDPANPENLRDCLRALEETDAEFAVAFDGDGDRLGVATRSGGLVFPDLILMLYAERVLKTNPGAKVVYDVKCTRMLKEWVGARGGIPVMSRTGHSFIKKLMRDEDALLGGEMSGHFFFRDRWSGYDDAIYAAARLVELASESGGVNALLEKLPETSASPELQISLEGLGVSAQEAIERVAARLLKSKEGTPNRTDGLRMEYPNGFGLIRASNTTSTLVLRFEGDSPADLEEIRGRFREALQVAGLAGVSIGPLL